MRRGGSKSKGSSFERRVCSKLSLWVTEGERKDCFWRSAISGGRATVRRRKGEQVKTQTGDICSIDPLGHYLTDMFYIECKHYKNLRITSFLLSNAGLLAQFWTKTKVEAKNYGKKPMLIAKQNQYPLFVMLPRSVLPMPVRILADVYSPHNCTIVLFDNLVTRTIEDLMRCYDDYKPVKERPRLRRGA